MQGVWEQNWELEIGQALDGFEILLPTKWTSLRAISVHDYYRSNSEVLRLFALDHHMFTTALQRGSLDASACLPVPTYSAVLIIWLLLLRQERSSIRRSKVLLLHRRLGLGQYHTACRTFEIQSTSRPSNLRRLQNINCW